MLQVWWNGGEVGHTQVCRIRLIQAELPQLAMFGGPPPKKDTKRAYAELKSSLALFGGLVATIRFLPYLFHGIQRASA